MPGVTMAMRVLIVGCGYVGEQLGRTLLAPKHEVWGICRTTVNGEALRRAGIHPLVLDITQPGSLSGLEPRFDWIVNALSSKGGGIEGYRELYLRATHSLLEWMRPSPPRRYLHLSSTSVYGQTDGSWVTETSPTNPESPTSMILIETENLVIQERRATGLKSSVLRSAGIYGPQRGHLFLQYLKGEATLTGEGNRWLNMIHRDDLATCILAALEAPSAPPILNVCDDFPVTERAFFEGLSLWLGKPLPPSLDPREKPKKRGHTDKRVSNAQMKESLGVQLSYPTFKEGYAKEIEGLGLLRKG